MCEESASKWERDVAKVQSQGASANQVEEAAMESERLSRARPVRIYTKISSMPIIAVRLFKCRCGQKSLQAFGSDVIQVIREKYCQECLK